jgi:hypothetical protein
MKRRDILSIASSSLASASIGATFATAKTVRAQSAPSSLVFNVRADGATGDGVNDDTAAIRATLQKAMNVGGTVLFPPGTYRVTESIEINRFVTLKGEGWGTPPPPVGPVPPHFNNNDPLPGSWIKITEEVGGFRITGRELGQGRGSIIRDLGIRHNQPDSGPSFSPRNYSPAIEVNTDDVLIENVMMLNPTRGIHAHDDGHNRPVGRLRVNGLWGQPLEVGIEIDNLLDTAKINDVHFWPFWDSTDDVQRFLLNAGNAPPARTAFKFWRADGIQMTNIFAYGYQHGIELLDSGTSSNITGVTKSLMASNLYLDASGIGLRIVGPDTVAHIANSRIQGAGSEGSSIDRQGTFGVIVEGANSRLQLVNVDISNFRCNCLRANSGRVWTSNLRIDNWNWSHIGFPGVSAPSGTIWLGSGFWFENKPNEVDPADILAGRVIRST